MQFLHLETPFSLLKSSKMYEIKNEGIHGKLEVQQLNC